MQQRALFALAAAMAVGCVGLLGCQNATPPAAPTTPSAHALPLAPHVSALLAWEQNVSIEREAIGTVAAYYSVTVHPQVDGRLDEVRFAEGQTVKKGDLLAVIDPRPYDIALKNAEATLLRDRATWRNARVNAQRYEALYADKMIPQQQLTDQQALVAQSEATVAIDEAQVLQAKLQLDYAHIKAPIDGVTGVRLIDPGNVVRTADGNGLLIINQMDPIAVLFPLPEDELRAVWQAMQQGALQAVAYARDGVTKLAEGELKLVDNQINVASGTIRLKAVFANPQRRLWPNQFVKVRLRLKELNGRTVVPNAAVVHPTDAPALYVLDDNSHAKRWPVHIDAVQDDLAVLHEPLPKGTWVIVDGQASVRDGGLVQARRKKREPAAETSASDRSEAPSR